MIYDHNYFREIGRLDEKIANDESIYIYMGSGKTANNHIVKGLKKELIKENIIVTEGTFDRVIEDVVLADAKYDIITIHESSIQLFHSNDFQSAVTNYIDMVENVLKKNPNTLVIANTLEYLPFRIIGNLALSDETGLISIINEANQTLSEIVSENFKINDVNFIANYIGLRNYFDERSINNFSYSGSLEAQYYCLISLRNVILSWMGKTKKGIVTDLDNTLWPGIVGDETVEGIQKNLLQRKNLNFKVYQNILEKMSMVGDFITISSKNNKEFEDSVANIINKPDFFSLKAINWERKSDNIQKIANSLNINTRDLVFIDDNIREIEEVNTALSNDIESIHFIKSLSQFAELEWNGWFEKVRITEVDRKRINKFKSFSEIAMTDFADFQSFIDSLKVKLTFEDYNENNAARILQLLNKTNQFNNNKKIFTSQKLIDLLAGNNRVVAISYEDKLGQEGVVSVIIFNEEENNTIHHWVMSCRVFKRGVEKSVLEYLFKNEKVEMYYEHTDKNNYFIEFLQELDKKQFDLRCID